MTSEQDTATTTEPEVDQTPEQIRVRREKRARLLERGHQPYPVEVPRTHTLARVRETWGGLETGQETEDVVGVAGRIVHLRNTGKLCFAQLQEGFSLDADGAHTMTVFGLHVPDALVPADGPEHDAVRDRLQENVLQALESVLAEPVEDLLLRDADGRPCVETRTTKDLERSLGLPGGHIFHGPLAWPFVEDGDPLGTPAERWGVATRHPRVLLAGSGARRGGGVSGLGGHGAAMAVLEAEGLPRP